jgi:hypothetical protein
MFIINNKLISNRKMNSKQIKQSLHYYSNTFPHFSLIGGRSFLMIFIVIERNFITHRTQNLKDYLFVDKHINIFDSKFEYSEQ